MKALVTGASGFIGSTLIDELSSQGFEVHALMRKTSSAKNLSESKFERREGDLSDRASLERAVVGMDYVFHLAGVVTARNRAEYLRHNAGGTKNLAEAIARANPAVKRVVYVSSLAAGGPSRPGWPRDESEPDSPVSAYGESKLEGERELQKHKDTFGVAIVRPPIVYGPRDTGVFTVIQAVARNLMMLPSSASADGQKHYSHIHVRDLVRGIIQIGIAPVERVASGSVYYLSANDEVTYEQLMMTIADRLGRKPFRIPVPRIALRVVAAALSALSFVTRRTFPLNLDKLNEILPDYWVCSNDKAKTQVGFAPEYDLATGMADTIEWYKLHGML